jgi:hypothetical protein
MMQVLNPDTTKKNNNKKNKKEKKIEDSATYLTSFLLYQQPN